ncbi:thiamine-monophosphate kinase [Thioalkalivibrio sp. ALE21]|uniref:thiamine-phosphate kinase n=1 Tax=Thioalkalivibrio sp. ALE21 TaxID=1158175 RepID=UPI000D86DC69|nr:thiamine-phosphate kinase [Thioalkalivibrio sp. ALE21]PYG02471.1 thiamine-monophosphate kinase [Thioalkalivibrio sp. ALE21]
MASPSLSEFDLIRRYFRPAGPFGDPVADARVVLGVGDDAALLRPDAGHEVVVSTDTVVEGRHFFPDHPPESLGHKALAASLSDLAAMGAEPLGVLLSLAVPEAEDAWLTPFSEGFLRLARAMRAPLVGGDTVRGPCSAGVTVLGQVPAGRALQRSGARPADRVVVTGELGGAAIGLAAEIRRRDEGARPPDANDPVCKRLFWPQPRLAAGLALREHAHAAIDLSDGLLADLEHVCAASGCGARVDWPAVPLDPALAGADAALARDCALGGGDDYELLLAVPPEVELAPLAEAAGVALHVIGEFTAGDAIRVVDAAGAPLDARRPGHDHFAD